MFDVAAQCKCRTDLTKHRILLISIIQENRHDKQPISIKHGHHVTVATGPVTTTTTNRGEFQLHVFAKYTCLLYLAEHKTVV